MFLVKVWRLNKKVQSLVRKFKSHWCPCLLQSRPWTLPVIVHKQEHIFSKTLLKLKPHIVKFQRLEKNNIQSSLGTYLLKLILTCGEGVKGIWSCYHVKLLEIIEIKAGSSAHCFHFIWQITEVFTLFEKAAVTVTLLSTCSKKTSITSPFSHVSAGSRLLIQ